MLVKYRFIMEPSEGDNVSVKIELGQGFVTLAEIIKNFENFLRACDFSLSNDSHLDIIKGDENN